MKIKLHRNLPLEILINANIMENSFKKNLMTQMLDHVPDLGWTWDALHKGAKTVKKAKLKSEISKKISERKRTNYWLIKTKTLSKIK